MLSQRAPSGYREGMTNTVYQNDLPDGLNLGPMVAHQRVAALLAAYPRPDLPEIATA